MVKYKKKVWQTIGMFVVDWKFLESMSLTQNDSTNRIGLYSLGVCFYRYREKNTLMKIRQIFEIIHMNNTLFSICSFSWHSRMTEIWAYYIQYRSFALSCALYSPPPDSQFIQIFTRLSLSRARTLLYSVHLVWLFVVQSCMLFEIDWEKRRWKVKWR